MRDTTRDRSHSSSTLSQSLSRTLVATAAQMAIRERPKVTSPWVGNLLWGLMVLGLIAFAAGLTVLAVFGFCHLLLYIGEQNPGAIPEWLHSQLTQMIPELRMILLYCMLGSILYGFASFIWFKFETHRVFGATGSYLLFLVIPALLMATKQFEAELAVWMSLEGEGLPDLLIYLAKYYSFGWYVLLVLLAVLRYRSEATERITRAFARMWLLALLCYVPYGYVLFVGEGELLGEIFTAYVGDLQLMLWALLPLRR